MMTDATISRYRRLEKIGGDSMGLVQGRVGTTLHDLLRKATSPSLTGALHSRKLAKVLVGNGKNGPRAAGHVQQGPLRATRNPSLLWSRRYDCGGRVRSFAD